MRYLPLTEEDREEILKICRVRDFVELTPGIPDNLRLKKNLDIGLALSEPELIDELSALAEKNSAAKKTCLMGNGVYDHEIPATIDYLVSRGEFLTAYTPYQPEISQGTLQSIFEFQSMVSDLLGVDVCNASLYDGGTSVVEAVLMAARIHRKKNGGCVLVSEGVFPETVELLKTYLTPLKFKIVNWKLDEHSFTHISDSSKFTEENEIFAVVAQSPNKFGCVENWKILKKVSEKLSATSIGYVSHMHSTALFQCPGNADIDIAVAELQSLGIPMGFGGPHLGVLATKKKLVRQMPGRLVGLTEDSRDERAFCVTLATREQHIRRERATSNICSNQNLMALRATVYLSLLGKEGFKKCAEICRDKTYFLKGQLQEVCAKYGLPLGFVDSEVFNEFTLLAPQSHRLFLDDLVSTSEKADFLLHQPNSLSGHGNKVASLKIAVTEKLTLQRLNEFIDLFKNLVENRT